MSRDLRKAMHDAAPRPTRDVDIAALARRGRRLKSVGVASLVVMIILATGTTWFITSSIDNKPQPVPAGPAEDPLPSGIPTGPRYVVMSGTFEDEIDWGRYQGQEWRLEAWSGDGQTCWSFEMGDDYGSEGVSCNPLGSPIKRAFGQRLFTPPGNFGNEYSISVGQVSAEVASVRFEMSGRRVQTLTVEPVLAPPESGSDWRLRRYYIAFLPPTDRGEMVALDRSNKVLGRRNLCHGNCLGAYERELEDAKGNHTRVLYDYEGEPVLIEKNMMWGLCPVDPEPLTDADVDAAAEIIERGVKYLFVASNEWRFRAAEAVAHRGPRGMFTPERRACGGRGVHRTAVVNVEFPRWRGESASMGAASYYVSRTADGWVIWRYTG